MLFILLLKLYYIAVRLLETPNKDLPDCHSYLPERAVEHLTKISRDIKICQGVQI